VSVEQTTRAHRQRATQLTPKAAREARGRQPQLGQGSPTSAMDEAALDAQNEVEVVEQYEISDDEADEFDYDAVEAPDDEEDDDDDDEDFAAALASVQRLDEKSRAGSTVASQRDIGTPAAKPTLTQVRPEVVDDFIRNFLIKVGMSRTLDNFNSEWYDLQQKGKLAEVYTDTVPDIYVRNQDLDERVVALQQQLDKMRIITEKAQGTWDKFRKERDFHRMHHRRVVQEKAKLTTDLQRLRKHYLSYEPTLKDLQKKYEVAMKEKMCVYGVRFPTFAPSSGRHVDGVEAAALPAWRPTGMWRATIGACRCRCAMPAAHPPRAQAHAARAGSDQG
jgi:hypothetical protein